MHRTCAALLLVPAMLLAACSSTWTDDANRELVLATTTSTQDSGLLDELLPAFTADTGWTAQTIAVGSGQAIELGRRGEADALLVHSPAAEQELVAQGSTGRRLLVMHNDFVLVGPAADPAGIAGAAPAEALARIATAQAPFVTRGDDSGTEARELDLWADAGVEPGGPWYTSTGQGMGATLRVASERGGYTLSDRATFLAQRDTLELEVINEGDPSLLNIYHVIEMTATAGDGVRVDGAQAFADWIVGPDAQRRIGEFGAEEFGEALFVPDAGKSVDELGG